MTSPTGKLKMGMVGGGAGAFIGAVHRMAAALDQQIELVAGCFSRDVENTRATGRQLGLDPSRCYDTFEQMAAAEARLPADKRIDFVSIVTPTVSHFPIARAFLGAGFHVVCDKPLAWSLAEARELVALVEKSGLVFALTHNYTGYPLIRHARHLCRTGQIGTVRKVIVEYLQDFLAFPHEKHGRKGAIWRVDPAQVGPCGTILEVGVHCVNLLEYVTGDPIAQFCADRATFLPDRVLEEDANFLLRLRGGGKGIMTVSQIAIGEENNLRLRIYGSEGAILWEQENPNTLSFYRYGQPRQTLTRGHREYLSEAANACTRIPTGHPEGYLEAFATIYQGVVEAIRRHAAGNPMPSAEYQFATVRDGLRGIEFGCRSVESCDGGSKWVKLEA
jgi:predicted dehydrogenase